VRHSLNAPYPYIKYWSEDGSPKHVANCVLMTIYVLCLAESIKFYIHGSVHRESNLITVQQDATYSVCYTSLGSSTCFAC